MQQLVKAVSHPVTVSLYPPPSKFPLHSINMLENPGFIGRESQLYTLSKLLIDEHNASKPVACVLHGNPGVGMSQTALKFVYQYKANFDAIIWVNADPEEPAETLRTFGIVCWCLLLRHSINPQMRTAGGAY